jgi:hypothetical protein
LLLCAEIALAWAEEGGAMFRNLELWVRDSEHRSHVFKPAGLSRARVM